MTNVRVYPAGLPLQAKMHRTETLPCGCVRGSRLCPKAQHLWTLVNDSYACAKQTGDWNRYDRARRDYYGHYGEEPPF